MTITATAPRASSYRGRLRWWTELPLIAVIYGFYSAARLVVRGDVDDAVQHGADILHLEQILHLDPERWFNRLFTRHAFLGVPADFAYASLHYVVTPVILIWLWRRRPTHYRLGRTWLLISTMIGLIGFTLVPTAPPRLLDTGHGFIDTMAQYGSYGWWGTDASAPRGMGHLTNQYAAMPSLHVGWSLWCGVILWRYGRNRAVRGLGLLYPLLTSLVVMGTANHYLLDAAAGVAVMGIGYLLARPALRLADRAHERTFGRKGRAAGTAAAAAAPGVTSGAAVAPGVASGAGAASVHGVVSGAGAAPGQRGASGAQSAAGSVAGSTAPESVSVPRPAGPMASVPSPSPAPVPQEAVTVPAGADDEDGDDPVEASRAAYPRGERAARSRMS